VFCLYTSNQNSKTNRWEIKSSKQVPPTVETEMKDQKQISLERMRSSLNEINAQIASMQNSTYLTDEQKKTMTTQKEIIEKAIRLLEDPNVTFDQYEAQMGLLSGGSKKKSKSRAKKSRAKKSRAKKSRAKKSRAKKSRAKKSRAKKSRAKKHRS
jgi:hypothetical protein